MEYIINVREPKVLFHYFEDICAIPHGSSNESAIADYIESFGIKHGLYVYRDANRRGMRITRLFWCRDISTWCARLNRGVT